MGSQDPEHDDGGTDARTPLERLRERLGLVAPEAPSAPEPPAAAEPSPAPHEGYQRAPKPDWWPSEQQARRLTTTVLRGSSRRLCGAWAGSRDRPCLCPVVEGAWRCARHGGRSTGPRTAEGRARISSTSSRTNREAHAARRILQKLAGEGRLPEGIQWPPSFDDDEEQAA